MVIPALASVLFGGIRGISGIQGMRASSLGYRDTLRSLDDLEGAISVVERSYAALRTTALKFYSDTIGKALQLNNVIRQSSTVLAGQFAFTDEVGNNIDDFNRKISAIGPIVKNLQREIELATRNIVGATTQQTNTVFNNVLLNFGELQGQTKEYSDALAAVPDLVASLTSGLNTFQIPQYQTAQEIRALIRGIIDRNALLANQLGITAKEIKAAKARGELIDFINERLSAAAQANALFAKGVANSTSNIQEFFDILGRETGQKILPGLEDVLFRISTALFDAQEKANEVGGRFGEVFSSYISAIGGDLAKITEDVLNSPILPLIGSIAELLVKVIGEAIGLVTTAIRGWTTLIRRVSDELANIPRVIEKIFNFEFDAELDPNVINIDTSEIESAINAYEPTLVVKVLQFAVRLIPFIDIKQREILKTAARLRDQNKEEIERLFSEGAALDLNLAISSAKSLAKAKAEVLPQIETFAFDVTKTLEENLSDFRGTIDFSKLSSETIREIENILKDITSSSSLIEAKEEVKRLLSIEAIGGEKEAARLNLTYESISQKYKETVDNITELKKTAEEAGGSSLGVDLRLRQLGEQAEELLKMRRQIELAADSALQTQIRRLEELKESGNASQSELEEVTAEIEKLKNTVREGDLGELSVKIIVPDQATVDKALENFSAAQTSFVNAAAQNEDTLKLAYKALIKELDNVRKLGVLSFEETFNVLNNAIANEKLGTEERIAAYEKLKKILKEEQDIRSKSLNIEKETIALRVAVGDISDDQAKLLQAEVDLSKTLLEEQQKLKEIQAFQLLLNKSSAEEVRKEIADLKVKNDELSKAELKDKELLLTRLETKGVVEEQQELELELIRLSIEKQKAAKQELEIQVQLDEITKARKVSEAEFSKIVAERNQILKELAISGANKKEVKERKEVANIIQLEENLQRDIAELAERRLIFEEKRRELAKEGVDTTVTQAFIDKNRLDFLSRETEIINQQTGLLQAQYDLEQLRIDNIIAAEEELLKNDRRQVESAEELNQAALEYEETLFDSIRVQQEAIQLAVNLASELNSIRQVEIDIQLRGISQVADIKKELDDIASKIPQGSVLDLSLGETFGRFLDGEVLQMYERLTAEAENLAEAYGLSLTSQEKAEEVLQRQLDLTDEQFLLKKEEIERNARAQSSELEIQEERIKLDRTLAEARSVERESELEFQRATLELERERTRISLERGEIEQESAEKILRALDNQSNALREQQRINETLRTNELDRLNNSLDNLRNQERINEEKAEQQLKENNIEKTNARIDLIRKQILDKIVQTNENLATTNQQLERSTTLYARRIIYLEDEQRLLEPRTKTVTFQTRTPILGDENRPRVGGSSRARTGGTGGTGGIGGQQLLPRDVPVQQLVQLFIQSEILKKLRDRGTVEEIRRRETAITSLEERLSELIEISSESTKQIFEIEKSVFAQSAEKQLDEILASRDFAQDLAGAISDNIEVIDDDRLIKAINEGRFNPDDFDIGGEGNRIFLNPATGELVVEGTRPDLANLEELIELRLGNDFNSRQLTELEFLNENVQAFADELGEISPDIANSIAGLVEEFGNSSEATLDRVTKEFNEVQSQLLESQEDLNKKFSDNLNSALQDLITGQITEVIEPKVKVATPTQPQSGTPPQSGIATTATTAQTITPTPPQSGTTIPSQSGTTIPSQSGTATTAPTGIRASGGPSSAGKRRIRGSVNTTPINEQQRAFAQQVADRESKAFLDDFIQRNRARLDRITNISRRVTEQERVRDAEFQRVFSAEVAKFRSENFEAGVRFGDFDDRGKTGIISSTNISVGSRPGAGNVTNVYNFPNQLGQPNTLSRVVGR